MVKKLKYDARYLISGILLILTAATAVTGLIADLRDLNDFIPHTYLGYGMAILACAHTVLEWPRLWAYARSRVRRRSRVQRTPSPKTRTDVPAAAIPASPGHMKPGLTRRTLLGLLVSGAGGFMLGQRAATRARLPGDADSGIQYHAWSKPTLPNPLNVVLDWGQRPPQYKVYPDAPRVTLPLPGDTGGLSLEATLQQRRSIRDYAEKPVALEALSHLLFYADGINAERYGLHLRAAPSAGALYPIETYVIAHRVDGLEPGLYHYVVQDHALATLRTEDLQNEIVSAGILQGFLGKANVVVILTAIFQRLRWKYQERSYRYALLEAGHIGQNVYLAATSMGMGACAVGAFDDDAVNALVGVDGLHEAALYLLAVGAL